MTYQKIKDTLVNEKNIMTEKDFKKLLISMGLSFMGFMLALNIVVVATIGLSFSILIGIIGVVMFMVLLDFLIEESEKIPKIRKLTKFWWITYILAFVVWLSLKYLGFY